MKYLIACLISILVFPKLYAQQVVAYYPFNLSTNDQGPNQINPTYVGPMIDYDNDRFGRPYSALKFDGLTGSYLRMPADSLPTGDRTISLWFKAASVENKPQLLSYGGNSPSNPPGTSFHMGLNTSGSAAYQTSAHYNTNVVNYPYAQAPVNQWIHYVVVIAGNTTKIYVNGELKANEPGSFISATVVAGKDFALGVMVNANGIAPYTDPNAGYFRGLLDDVRIYKTAMTDQQVAQLYKLESTGLVAYYPFNGNAQDESGNGNHGVAVNNPTYSTDRFNQGQGAIQMNDNPARYITVENSNTIQIRDQLSISVWVKRTSLTTIDEIVNKGGDWNQLSCHYGLVLTPGELIFKYLGGYHLINAPQDLNWHHYTITTYHNSPDVKFYVDGSYVPTFIPQGPIQMNGASTANLTIGAMPTTYYSKNVIDDLRIYNRVLHPNEIQELADFPMMPDLLAWLPMNGHVDDVSSNGHYGSVYGNATPTKDRYGNQNSAYFINGLESGITLDISNTMDFVGQPFSLSTWVKYSNITGPPSAVVSKHNCGYVNGYVLSVYDNIPRFFLAEGGNWSMISANTAYNDEKWHHLVATYDGVNSQKLYIDGQLHASAQVVYNNPSGSAAPILIGDAAGNCGGGEFQCAIDDFKPYGKDLDSMQVKALYRQSRGSGNALAFLEANQTEVDLDTTIIGDEFSLEAWVKTPGFEGPQYVITGKNTTGSWAFGMQNEKLILKKGDEPTIYSPTVAVYNNAWHHIAVTVKNNQYKFYFDGSPAGNGSTPALPSIRSRYFLGQYLNGSLDEVRIWRKELNQDQIQKWMNRKIATGHPEYVDLMHHYNFDEPNLTKTIDVREEQTGQLINGPQYIVSGAPLGDTAVVSFNPVATQGVELVTGGDSVKISGWVGSPTGVAVYAVKDVPANTKGTQGLGGNNQYFGTKSYGEAPSIVQLYKYGNNLMVNPEVQPTVALYYRKDNASSQWGAGTEVIHNSGIKQFFSPGPGGEWILGSTGIPLEVKSLNANGLKREWTVYPNPASETLYFKGFSGQAIFTLRDIAGKTALSPTILGENQGLNVSDLQPGLYFLEIREGSQRYAAKILIH